MSTLKGVPSIHSMTKCRRVRAPKPRFVESRDGLALGCIGYVWSRRNVWGVKLEKTIQHQPFRGPKWLHHRCCDLSSVYAAFLELDEDQKGSEKEKKDHKKKKPLYVIWAICIFFYMLVIVLSIVARRLGEKLREVMVLALALHGFSSFSKDLKKALLGFSSNFWLHNKVLLHNLV